MIISLRGTSGSGKSTIVRKITALYDSGGVPIFMDGRRKAYYTVHARGHGQALVVPGHYEIDCGGVDTLPSLDAAYDIARQASREGKDVLMEGKNMSDGVPHALSLFREGFDVRVLHVCEPLSRCIRSVRKRGSKMSEETVHRTHEKCMRDVQSFQTLGMPHVRQENREESLKIVRWWLCL